MFILIHNIAHNTVSPVEVIAPTLPVEKQWAPKILLNFLTLNHKIYDMISLDSVIVCVFILNVM